MPGLQRARRNAQIVGVGIDPGPAAGLFVGAETALVVGIG